MSQIKRPKITAEEEELEAMLLNIHGKNLAADMLQLARETKKEEATPKPKKKRTTKAHKEAILAKLAAERERIAKEEALTPCTEEEEQAAIAAAHIHGM